MKRGILILIAALVVGITSFVITRQQYCCTVGSTVSAHDGTSLLPELEWLHHELKLTDEQFAKVQALHLAYKPTCEALCMKIAAAHRKVQSLATSGDITSAEFAAALQAQGTVRVECQQAMLNHLHETAVLMSPEQARQYLAVMLPQVLGDESTP
jgi:Spy/CpxP family protein refolding chaperone